jgi:hypothetical protein
MNFQKLCSPRFLICDPRSYGDLGPHRPCREPNYGFFRNFDFAPWGVLKKRVFCMFFNFGDFSRIQFLTDFDFDFFMHGKHLGTRP